MKTAVVVVAVIIIVVVVVVGLGERNQRVADDANKSATSCPFAETARLPPFLVLIKEKTLSFSFHLLLLPVSSFPICLSVFFFPERRDAPRLIVDTNYGVREIMK